MQKQFFQRISLVLKDHSYFLHTHYPFSSVLLPLPQKLHLLKPLLKQLKRKQNFSLEQQLSRFKIKQQETEVVTVQSNIIKLDSIYGINFDKDTQFVIRNPQTDELQISDQKGEDKQVLAVILYRCQKGEIKYINTSNSYVYQFLLKLTVLGLSLKVLNILENNTRVQNFHKVKDNKKQ